MVHFMFTEPAVPPVEQLVPKKIDAAKTKEVLEAAKDFVHQCFSLDHEGAEELAKSKAEELGDAMYRACCNKNFGYDQGNRLDCLKHSTTTTTSTECDCSSLVRLCIKEAFGKDVFF